MSSGGASRNCSSVMVRKIRGLRSARTLPPRRFPPSPIPPEPARTAEWPPGDPTSSSPETRRRTSNRRRAAALVLATPTRSAFPLEPSGFHADSDALTTGSPPRDTFNPQTGEVHPGTRVWTRAELDEANHPGTRVSVPSIAEDRSTGGIRGSQRGSQHRLREYADFFHCTSLRRRLR